MGGGQREWGVVVGVALGAGCLGAYLMIRPGAPPPPPPGSDAAPASSAARVTPETAPTADAPPPPPEEEAGGDPKDAPPPDIPVEEPPIDYSKVEAFVATGDYEGVNPHIISTRCDPPPCVYQIGWIPNAPDSERFHQDIYRMAHELGQGVGKPNISFREGTSPGEETRTWIFWIPDMLSFQEFRRMFHNAADHVHQTGGPALPRP